MSAATSLLAGARSTFSALLACLERHSLTAEAHAICACWGVTLADAHGPRRFNDVTRARHRVWVLLRERTGLSYPQIAALFGRDHTSILSACKRWDRSQAAFFLPKTTELLAAASAPRT